MAVLVFITVALAFWHFTVFVPDHFRFGILGALGASLLGGVLSGIFLQFLLGRGINETDFWTLLFALPGTVLFLLFAYYLGDRSRNVDDSKKAPRDNIE